MADVVAPAAGLARARRRAAAPAPGPAQGQHRRRGDDRRAARRRSTRTAASRGLRGVLLDAEGPHFSFGASVEEHLAERCAAMLAVAARADPGDGRVPGADPGGGARPVPGRRPRGRAGRRADLRRARRAVRPARDQARRVRARGLVACCRWRISQAARRRPAVLGPQRSAAARRWRWAWCTRGRRPRGRRAGVFRRAPGAAAAPPRWPAPWPRCARRACASCANGWPRSSACTSTA